MKEILNYLFTGQKLSKEEARQTLYDLAIGKYTEIEMASFLTVYNMRPVSTEELLGFREAMIELALKVETPFEKIIDVCGTGGDEKRTFNISTLTAFVVAASGAKVVKHGNYAVSSSSGSSNIMEYFGYKFSNSSDKLLKELDKTGICYLHAPLFHPAMKNVAPVRKALKVKTFFNILGPMINPAIPNAQLIGVFDQNTQEIYANVYSNLDINFAIVHSLDGYDEISLTDRFRYITKDEDKVVDPTEMNLPKIKSDELYAGNTQEDAAKTFIKILQGEGTEGQNNVIIANSAFALKCYFPEKSVEECIIIAKDSLLGKKAYDVFKKLIELQN